MGQPKIKESDLQQEFSDYLVRNDLRKTKERTTVLSQICSLKSHFDVEMLFKRMEEIKYRVSRSTIYNTIELLVNANIVVRHQFNSQLVQYELKCLSIMHHHTICTNCGAVQEVKNVMIENVFSQIKMPKFDVEHYSLYLFGICSKCKYRMNRAAKRKKLNNLTP